MATYTARGLTLRYEQAGDGRPVILLHGMSNHCLAWAPQLDALAAAGWRAVLPDLAGHGRSDPVTGRTSTEDLAGDVVASAGTNLTFPAAEQVIASWKAIWLAPDGPRKRLEATWEGLASPAYRDSPAGRAFYASWWRLLGEVSGQGLAAVADGLLSFDVTEALAGV